MGRGMKKPRNPFRVIRKTGKWIGYTLLGLLLSPIFVMAVYSVWTDCGWGAWALTVPLIIAAGLTAATAFFATIGWLIELLGEWWKKRERAYEQKARESRT